MLGEWLTAEKALDWNLCHAVLPEDTLVTRALEFSKTLAKQNQASLRLNKVLMNRWLFGSGGSENAGNNIAEKSGSGSTNTNGNSSGNKTATPVPSPYHAEDAITARANPSSPHPLGKLSTEPLPLTGASSQADASAADFYGSYRDQFERHLALENALMMVALRSPETVASMNEFQNKHGKVKKKGKM
jgi:enoyl-CoA hydratase/carnithine racemase